MIVGITSLTGQQGGMPPPGGLAPVAGFSFQAGAPAGSTIQFTDHSFNGPTSWNWKINGSQFSIIQNPTYYFGMAGTFDISLTASNSFGSSTVHNPMLVF